ncbi:MAG TPA: hypothetical protein VIF15_07780 [Polyangiaceae bacterium]
MCWAASAEAEVVVAAEAGVVAAAEAGVVAAALAVDVRRRALISATLLAAMLAATAARAEPTETDLRAARQLFVQAEKEEDAGRWSEALEDLRRVAAVKRTAGVRYHVALCEEHLGQLASALDEYTAAQLQARAENAQDVLRTVGKQLADLSPRVPRLTIRVVPDVPDVVVRLDGIALSAATLGNPIPLDPGPHQVEAGAPARATSTESLTLLEHDVRVLELKLGEPVPSPAPPLPAQSAPASTAAPTAPTAPLPPDALPPRASTRTGAIVATVTAVVLAGGGVGAFVLAGNAHGDAVSQCAQVVSGSAGACDGQRGSVRTWDFVAGGAWLGAVAVATYAVILWTRPAPPEASGPDARLLVGPGSVGVGGRF